MTPTQTEIVDSPGQAGLLMKIFLLAETPLAFMWLCQVPAPRRQSGSQPFAGWAHVVEFLSRLARGESVVVLKARQIGVSWAVALYSLWVAMFKPNSVVLIISKSQGDSDLVLEHCRFMYDQLPQWLRDAKPVRAYRAQKPGLLSFQGGGQINTLASTPNAGRGYNPTVAILDEYAYHPWAEATYKAVRPALDGGGQLVVVSTASGPRGAFHRLYMQARQGSSTMKSVFYPWWSRPNRQRKGNTGDPVPSEKWLERTKSDFLGILAEFKQEFPGTEAEAWVVLTGLVYGLDETGELIFDGRSHPAGNLAPDPCAWEECQRHYAVVDWGGGDPTVVDLFGVTSSGRMHQFAELHWEGSVSVSTVALGIQGWTPKNGFDMVLCGADAPNSIQELKEQLGSPVRAAKTDRKDGFGYATFALRTRRLTFNPERCPKTIAEFYNYSWATTQDSNTKERYATRTPVDNHGDHKDCMRYFVSEVMSEEGVGNPYDVEIDVILN